MSNKYWLHLITIVCSKLSPNTRLDSLDLWHWDMPTLAAFLQMRRWLSIALMPPHPDLRSLKMARIIWVSRKNIGKNHDWFPFDFPLNQAIERLLYVFLPPSEICTAGKSLSYKNLGKCVQHGPASNSAVSKAVFPFMGGLIHQCKLG